jgi:hypothetical protein
MGLLVGLGVTSAVAGCGSDDGAKKARGPSDAGQAGTDAGGNTGDEEGGSPSMPGGHDAGGGPGQAGATPVGEDGGVAGADATAGAAGADAMAGAAGADSGPRQCPTGTADCDDDHTDCETATATDATNCGRCERACGATAACTNGLCEATVLLDPSGSSNWCDAVFSASTAYMLTCWGTFTEIRTTPLELGASVLGTQIKSYSVPVVAARGMLIDGNDVLFGLEESPSHLFKFPLDADGPEDVSIAYTFENATRFDAIQLVGDTFYWNHNTHTAAGQVQPGFIKKRTKTDISSTTLVSGLGLSYDLQVTGKKLVWLEKRTAVSALGVYRSPLAGAAVADVELVAEAGSGSYMAYRGGYVYWADKVASPNGKVRRLLVDDDAAVPEDVATGLNLPEGIATDDAYAYFKQLDALYRVPLSGGTPEQLSVTVPANDSQATAVYHVDEKYVYFAAGITAGNSTLVRVAK